MQMRMIDATAGKRASCGGSVLKKCGWSESLLHEGSCAFDKKLQFLSLLVRHTSYGQGVDFR